MPWACRCSRARRISAAYSTASPLLGRARCMRVKRSPPGAKSSAKYRWLSSRKALCRLTMKGNLGIEQSVSRSWMRWLGLLWGLISISFTARTPSPYRATSTLPHSPSPILARGVKSASAIGRQARRSAASQPSSRNSSYAASSTSASVSYCECVRHSTGSSPGHLRKLQYFSSTTRYRLYSRCFCRNPSMPRFSRNCSRTELRI
mmetsp:Transcript_36446/g.63569  ORF Transcript_36446/g.63569 Transcript_36446/m.63569 type:complete len:205 (+) Transcript_36446:1211-1825(+)